MVTITILYARGRLITQRSRPWGVVGFSNFSTRDVRNETGREFLFFFLLFSRSHPSRAFFRKTPFSSGSRGIVSAGQPDSVMYSRFAIITRSPQTMKSLRTRFPFAYNITSSVRRDNILYCARVIRTTLVQELRVRLEVNRFEPSRSASRNTRNYGCQILHGLYQYHT